MRQVPGRREICFLKQEIAKVILRLVQAVTSITAFIFLKKIKIFKKSLFANKKGCQLFESWQPFFVCLRWITTLQNIYENMEWFLCLSENFQCRIFHWANEGYRYQGQIP